MPRERRGFAGVGEGGGCGVEVADVGSKYGMGNLLAGARAAAKSREGMKGRDIRQAGRRKGQLHSRGAIWRDGQVLH